jgi:hypothetical protein
MKPYPHNVLSCTQVCLICIPGDRPMQVQMNKWWRRVLELCNLARREMLQTGQRWSPANVASAPSVQISSSRMLRGIHEIFILVWGAKNS